MKKIIFIFLSIFASMSTEACSCRYEWTNDYYSFLKNGTNLFVGEVMSVSENSEFKIFEFKVVDKLRSKYKSKVIVYSSKKGCGELNISEGIYLIEANFFNGRLHSGYCNFRVAASSKTFREDTALIKLFGRKSFTVNSTYFKGRVLNHKRVGVWKFYTNSDTSQPRQIGEYKHDKKHGIWTRWGDSTFYKNGKYVKAVSVVPDCPDNGKKFRRVQFKHESIMYYPDGSIYKKRTSKRYVVYYPSGVLKETAYINKHGYFYKSWNKYDEKGILKESQKLKNNNEISSNKYCCFD